MSACELPDIFESALDEAIPLSMQWDLTWRCDHKCVHCYLTERRQEELSYEEGLKALDQMAEAGVMMLLISGGDPFLRPDALALLQAARARAFDLKINTHGNFIDEKLADELAKLKPSRISISIYSEYAHEHDAVTLIQGSHSKSIAALERLKARGVPINIKTPVMSQNATGWAGVEQLAQTLGATWELDGNIIPDDQSDFGLCKIGVDPTERVLATLKAMAPHRHQAMPFDQLPSTPSSARTCSAGTVSGYLSPDGRVSPCINWREWMGSLRQQSFRDIWYHSKVAQRQREIRRASYLKDCEGCSFHQHCNYCPGLSHAETGDAGRRSAYVCERTHITMSALEHLTRLNQNQASIPNPHTEEALKLFAGTPTFAERQWAARSAGLSHPSEALKPKRALIQINEPRTTK